MVSHGVFYYLYGPSPHPAISLNNLTRVFTVRLIGGIDVICLGQNPDSIALIAIALATLGVGLIPLIISVLGIIRTM